MTHITIFGSGNMAQALRAFLARAEVETTLIARGEPFSGVATDAVLLAVPHVAHAALVADHADDLAGRIVIDISNPVSFDPLTHIRPQGGSAAVALAGSLPSSRVVKAFNTNYAGHLQAGEIDGHPLSVLVAGDDEQARAFVLDIVRRAAAEGYDVGPLERAAELEGLCFVQMVLSFSGQVPSDRGFVVMR